MNNNSKTGNQYMSIVPDWEQCAKRISYLEKENAKLQAQLAELEAEHNRVLMAVANAIRPDYFDVAQYYEADESDVTDDCPTA